MLPAWSITPVLSRVMTLVASAMLALGVKVAVQVRPPSLVLSPLRLPLATLKSAMSRPLTCSLKVTVTVAVSPIRRLVSLRVMLVAAGRTPSTTRSLLAPREPAPPGVGRVRTAFWLAASWMVPPLRLRAEVEA